MFTFKDLILNYINNKKKKKYLKIIDKQLQTDV